MDIICILTLLAACLIASSHCASHDVEWIYGMTENELCVAPGQAQQPGTALSIHLPPCLRRHRELRVREQPQRGGDEPGGVRGVHRHHARPRPRAHLLDRAHGGGGMDNNNNN